MQHLFKKSIFLTSPGVLRVDGEPDLRVLAGRHHEGERAADQPAAERAVQPQGHARDHRPRPAQGW